MPNSVPEEALGPVRSATGGAGVEGGPAIVSARPRRRAPRCPVCGRRCDGYDRLATRRWRATDLGASRCHPGYAPLRAGCPEHGAGAEAVPWARSAASRFASASGDQVAWLAPRMRGSALAEPVRAGRHTVGGICPGVEASPGEADGRGRAGGLRPVGTGETSHEGGHRHVTVVAGHDRGRGRLCGEGAREGADGRLPRPARGGAEERHRGRRRRRRPVGRRRRRRAAPRRRARRGPVPRRGLGQRRARRTREGRVARGEAQALPQAPPRAPQEGREAAGRPRQASEGTRVPAAREPRGPHGGTGVGARRAGAGGDGAVARLPARGGAAHGVPRRCRRRGGRARPPARVGVPLPDTRVRGAVAQGGAKAGGHPGVDRARGPRRPRRGGERQDQGRDRAGPRVPRHRQPHGPRDARVLGPETNAAGKGGGDVISTHTNSRSLV